MNFSLSWPQMDTDCHPNLWERLAQELGVGMLGHNTDLLDLDAALQDSDIEPVKELTYMGKTKPALSSIVVGEGENEIIAVGA